MKLAFRFLLLYTKSKRALFCVKLIVGFNLTNENCPDSMISASLHFTHIFKTCVSACEFLIFSEACLYATSVNVTSILSVVYIIYLGISLVHSFPSSLLLYTSLPNQLHSKINVQGFHLSFCYHHPQRKLPVSLSAPMATISQLISPYPISTPMIL